MITDVDRARAARSRGRRRYEGWIAADFESGAEVVRALAQADALPDVTRLSDPEETRVSLALSGIGGLKRTPARLLPAAAPAHRRLHADHGLGGRLRGRRAPAGALSARPARGRRGARWAERPGKAWSHGRFDGPYLRDELLDLGYFVETLETSHTWSRYQELYARGPRRACGRRWTRRARPGSSGATSRTPTATARRSTTRSSAPRRPGAELEQWRAVKTAACEAIVATGGTITHHHAVGRDHAPYMQAEVGDRRASRRCGR